MSDIRQDPRHEIERTLSLASVDSRRFPEWSMRYLSDDALRRIELEDLIDTAIAPFPRTSVYLGRIHRAAERLVDSLAQRERAGRRGLFQAARAPTG